MRALAEHSVTSLDVVHHADALALLRALPDGYVNCIVTSPPYYGLRDYSANGQIGLEDTPEQYVARLVELFREARRVLRDDGTAWINLGDTYANTKVGNTNEAPDKRPRPYFESGTHAMDFKKSIPPGLKPKDLIGIPWRVAFALQADGWWLRSDIIWHKPNPMPESVTDRPTKSHEYVFLLTKAERYWYDADAVREGQKESTFKRAAYGWNGRTDDNSNGARTGSTFKRMATTGELIGTIPTDGKRNRRTVWTVPTEPKPFQHFAMFPQALIEPMILAGCPAQVCAVCGAPYERVVDYAPNYEKRQSRGAPDGVMPQVDSSGWRPPKRDSLGFAPTCDCNADTRPGIVYDPFMGSGTTALVAQRLGRHYIGTDINAEYIELARRRLHYHGDDSRMVKEQEAGVMQRTLFDAPEAHDSTDAEQLALFEQEASV